MENKPPQSTKDGDQEDKAFVVITVRENLSKVAQGTVGVDVGSEQSSKPSIYKIPEFIREVQKKAFLPQLVSFGPYHHGEKHLASMELKKLEVFHNFHTRYGLDVEIILESVWSMLKELQESYDMPLEDKSKVDTVKFLQLMVVDGCFILEFFDNCPKSLKNMRAEIKRDMLLLENQLPMKLLHELCSIAHLDKQAFMVKVQSQYFNGMVPDEHITDDETRPCLHILDMYRLLLTGKKDKSLRQKFDKSDPKYTIIRHATHLREWGIKFEKSKSKSLMEVSFEGGVLSLPCMVLNDSTEPAFLNLMAFEKLHVGVGKKVTSFILLMDNLIDVDEDVSLLASKGILANSLGDDQAAAKLFNLLANGAAVSLNNHVATIQKKVNEHCRGKLNKWIASLRHNYFQNPWTIISLIAAFLGIAILILQVVYQICDYY